MTRAEEAEDGAAGRARAEDLADEEDGAAGGAGAGDLAGVDGTTDGVRAGDLAKILKTGHGPEKQSSVLDVLPVVGQLASRWICGGRASTSVLGKAQRVLVHFWIWCNGYGSRCYQR